MGYSTHCTDAMDSLSEFFGATRGDDNHVFRKYQSVPVDDDAEFWSPLYKSFNLIGVQPNFPFGGTCDFRKRLDGVPPEFTQSSLNNDIDALSQIGIPWSGNTFVVWSSVAFSKIFELGSQLFDTFVLNGRHNNSTGWYAIINAALSNLQE